jgi:hypothetical protein
MADAAFLSDKSVVIREKIKQMLYEHILTVTANIIYQGITAVLARTFLSELGISQFS